MDQFWYRAGEIEARAGVVVGGDVLEDAGLIPPVEEVCGRGEVTGSIGIYVQELDDPVGLGIVEGFKKDGVDDAEDGRVCPDAKRQGGDRGDGERGVGDQHAKRILKVVAKITHRFAILPRGWSILGK